MKEFAYILFFFAAISFSSAEISVTPIGISPQDANNYLSTTLKCKDGSKSFTRERLNDNFCDCADGSDEPGTSACPEGKFYCKNAGHTPVILYSSRVNDGICDCCDGSDEYDGKTKCQNSCWEAGKATREKLKKRLAIFKEGSMIRKKEIEHAKQMVDKEKLELASLKDEEKQLKKSVNRLKEAKEAIEKVEEEERKKKEKEEQSKLESEKLLKEQEVSESVDTSNQGSEQDSKDDLLSTIQNLDQNVESTENVPQEENIVSTKETVSLNVDNSVETTENVRHEENIVSTKETDSLESKASDETEGLSREELGRLVASRWTGEKIAENTNDNEQGGSDKKEDPNKLDLDENIQHEQYDEYSGDEAYRENEEDDKAYDDNDHTDDKDDHEDDKDDDYDEEKVDENNDNQDFEESDDLTEMEHSTKVSWWESIQQRFRKILKVVKVSKVSVDISEASHIRKEYDDLNHKLSKVQSRISSLEKKMKQDFGKELEFYSHYDQCFEQKENKYTYKVCPYKQTSQMEGHSSTNLGRWQGFKDSYKFMDFSNGDKCWNGPDRNMKIRLKCGLKNELSGVDEPSRCEYFANLLTPALCLEERIKDIEKRLDSLNQDLQAHDEL